MLTKEKKAEMEFIRQFVIMSIVFGILIGYTGFSITKISGIARPVSVTESQPPQKIVVIDPGHGGEDGGAIAPDGTAEKELNLLFGRTLFVMCKVLGTEAVLTRTEDTLLYDKYGELDDYTGRKKVYDLRNRLRITEEWGKDAVFVGIHMNKFGDPQYSGTQIYYSPNHEGSRELASMMQSGVRESLQPNNGREIKKAGSSIYLLNRMKVPAVLVECGFLSNVEETARLKEEIYKKEFSLTLAVSLGEFISMDP